MTARSKSSSPIESILADSNRLQKAIKSLADTIAALPNATDNEPFETLPVVREARSRLTPEWGALAKALDEVEEQLLSRAEPAADTYADRLLSHVRGIGLDAKGDSSHFAVDGIVYVVTDRVGGKVRVNDQPQSDLRVPSVAREIAAARDDLMTGRTSAKDFALSLASAYDAEIAAEGKSPGDQVRIDALHRRLLWLRQSRGFLSSFSARAFREYTRDQLRADLYGLVSTGARTPDGRGIQLDSGAETTGALWMFIPALGRAGYVGRLRLTKPND